MPSLSAQELEMALTVVKTLESEKYKDKNYLFLQPFDLNQVPGYVELVGPPMDLQTVRNKLQQQQLTGQPIYDSSEQVWFEIVSIFDKAMKYHAGKQTKWIGKLAKDMLKQMNKERKIAEKKYGLIPTAAVAISDPVTSSTTTNRNTNHSENAVPAATAATITTTTTTTTKLKIKSKNKVGKQLPTQHSQSLQVLASDHLSVEVAAPAAATAPAFGDMNRGDNEEDGGGGGGVTTALAMKKKKKAKVSLKLKLPLQQHQHPAQQPASTMMTMMDVDKDIVEVAAHVSSNTSTGATAAVSPPNTMSIPKKKSPAVETDVIAGAAAGPSVGAAPKKLKLKLSLKSKSPMNSTGAGSETASSAPVAAGVVTATTTTTTTMKESPKNSVASGVSPAALVRSNSSLGGKKPKISLKIMGSSSSHGGTEATTSGGKSSSGGGGAGKNTKSSAGSDNSKDAAATASATVTVTPANHGPSRGKELPKGVAESQAAAGAASTAATETNKKLDKKLEKKSLSLSPEKKIKAAKLSGAGATGKGSTTTGGKAKSKTVTKKQQTQKIKISKGKQSPIPLPVAVSATFTAADGAVAPMPLAVASTDPASTSAAPATSKPTTATGKSKKFKLKRGGIAGARSGKTASGVGGSKSDMGGTTSDLTAMPWPTQKQCAKVLAGLRRRQHKNIGWFLQPVSDKAIMADYKAKIKHPMDLSTVQSKLDKQRYASVADFCLDMRRIFANCLLYNTSTKDSLRPVAVQVLQTTEELMQAFLGHDTTGLGAKNRGDAAPHSYPRLFLGWRLCLEMLDTIYNLVNPSDGQPTVLFFLHPVSFFCGGQFPTDYLQKVVKPMDFSTVSANLLEGRYATFDDFAADCQLIISNCLTYYEGRDDGKIYIEQATRLRDHLGRQLDQLARYFKSSKGQADRMIADQPVVLAKPPIKILTNVLDDLRGLTYTDKATKITEAAMGPFEKPVSLVAFPDYAQHVKEPIDFQSIERKAKAGMYETAEDFELDVNLMFKNCEVYNSSRNGDHLVAMAKYGARHFRRVFYARMRAYEDPSSSAPPKSERPASSLGFSRDADIASTSVGRSSPQPPPNKKVKVDSTGLSKGKAGPRISITAAQSSAASNAAAAAAAEASQSRLKSPRPPNTAITQNKVSATVGSSVTAKSNQPVPLHIAIARVKEAYKDRRAVKSLESWEADCARYFKELMRHPWISAARPKFIFHVPVPILFPELRDAYAAKIRKPMDLTTIECELLTGKRYKSVEAFVEDVALVFANAIRFNKDGRDIGDPLSCAYYDASVHLLRFARWLSLELLSEYIVDIDDVDKPSPEGLPPCAWKLTQGNRLRARDEMELLVLKEPIDKSLEGDRYTWHEAECEKLLKALRHQSDWRFMSFFIQPSYPPDYAAFVSKPMDWERVQRTLKKRQYDKFGDIIEDLRLIFSNAIKYNSKMKNVNPVSAQAYDAAIYMLAKLENAINKLMLSVSDRLERERIDHANAEREIEAAEQAEEARIKATWKKDPSHEGSSPIPSRNDVNQKLRNRKASYRRDATDFEIPFFDEEDNGQHEGSYFEVVKLQKSMFEKQREELVKMRQSTNLVGAGMYGRLMQKEMAMQWVQQEAAISSSSNAGSISKDGNQSPVSSCENLSSQNAASSVLGELERKDRGPLQISLAAPRAKATMKRKRPLFDLE